VVSRFTTIGNVPCWINSIRVFHTPPHDRMEDHRFWVGRGHILGESIWEKVDLSIEIETVGDAGESSRVDGEVAGEGGRVVGNCGISRIGRGP